MNHIYRSVWNEKTASMVAVSEVATSTRSSSARTRGVTRSGFALKALTLSMMLAFAGGSLAAPAGGVVAAGSAGIASNGAKTTITQSTPSVVINWQGFGIAAGEAVQFAQPNANSVALN